MVVDIRVSAYAVLEADVQIVPEKTLLHHISHHPNPVFNLEGQKHDASWLVLCLKKAPQLTL